MKSSIPAAVALALALGLAACEGEVADENVVVEDGEVQVEGGGEVEVEDGEVEVEN